MGIGKGHFLFQWGVLWRYIMMVAGFSDGVGAVVSAVGECVFFSGQSAAVEALRPWRRWSAALAHKCRHQCHSTKLRRATLWGGKEADGGSCSHSWLDACEAGLFPQKSAEIFSAAQEWCWHTFSLGLPATSGNMWERWIHFPFKMQLLVRGSLKFWLKWDFA